MPRRTMHRHDDAQLTFDPVVYIPPVRINNPDGSITVRPGKPVVLNGEDEIGTAEAARIIGISQRRIQSYCDEGILKEGEDWRRPAGNGNYRIKRSSAIRLRGDAQQ